jgi:hypothetical protein
VAEPGTVEHEFTLFPKPEVCPMGLVVGWKLVQLVVGNRELRTIVHRLVRQYCGIPYLNLTMLENSL